MNSNHFQIHCISCLTLLPITGESYWEPTQAGYKTSDGKLILANGDIITDSNNNNSNDDDENELLPIDICSDCNNRYSIRSCNECGDTYCTTCYKSSHLVGSRRNHTYVLLGPVDCIECEERLAQKWCLTCGESHCKVCWEKLHSKDKRRFHPFCIIYPNGRIGTKMMTNDGQEVSYRKSF